MVFNSEAKVDETMKNLGKPKYLKLANFLDVGGCLDVLELEFDVKRIYVLRSISTGTIRGNHAHKSLMQIFLSTSGSFTINLTDGVREYSFYMKDGGDALFVPPGYWRTLNDFSVDAKCLVLASEFYNPADYIHDYQDFLLWRGIN
jgi:dTDP-4-dehydrorhamnose 3,5-epimerase-like enzyme